jgi:D-xylose transport system substrate-binding protein
MKVSFKRAIGAAVVALTLVSTVAACGNDDDKKSSDTTSSTSGSSTELKASSFTADFAAMKTLTDVAAKGQGMIGVLLPDTTTSARYETFDRPYLKAAFEAAGLKEGTDFKIDNAHGSASTMQTQAEADITQGATVLLIDPLDSGSGAAIEANATSKGLKVIDYDRLTKGGPADRTYVSFDNEKVGKTIGDGEVQCISNWKVNDPHILVMDGDPSDNNAKLFAQGYNGVLKSHFDDKSFTKVGEPAGTWTPSIAATTFEQQYTAHPEINAVITPNDDNANAVISVLQSKNIKAKTFPTTGQDASVVGLQNILKGFQCGTVYKPVYLEAQAAAAAALYLRAGEDVPKSLLNATTKDDQTNKDVQSIYLTPVWVTSANMASTVVKDQAVKVSELCVAAVAQACTAAGIS